MSSVSTCSGAFNLCLRLLLQICHQALSADQRLVLAAMCSHLQGSFSRASLGTGDESIRWMRKEKTRSRLLQFPAPDYRGTNRAGALPGHTDNLASLSVTPHFSFLQAFPARSGAAARSKAGQAEPREAPVPGWVAREAGLAQVARVTRAQEDQGHRRHGWHGWHRWHRGTGGRGGTGGTGGMGGTGGTGGSGAQGHRWHRGTG